MDITTYLDPINISKIKIADDTGRIRLSDIIFKYTPETTLPDLNQLDIVIIGVDENRRTVNKGCDTAPDEVRGWLYSLFSHCNNVNIADFGNIKRGNEVDDTYFAVKEVVAELLRNDVVVMIIGGGQDVTYGRLINIAAVDPIFDIGHDEQELNSNSYLTHIMLHQPNFLFNYTNIGYQTYFVDQDSLQLMKNLFFDTNRLGNARAELEETEPMVRNADMVSIDIASVKHADAPGTFSSMPNGFSGEEICKISRFAGMSDKLTSIGFYELNPPMDSNGQTAHLTAQMMWYFIDGFSNRRDDFPEDNHDEYVKFNVQLEGHDDDLIFLKSKKTDRWWMIVGNAIIMIIKPPSIKKSPIDGGKCNKS